MEGVCYRCQDTGSSSEIKLDLIVVDFSTSLWVVGSGMSGSVRLSGCDLLFLVTVFFVFIPDVASFKNLSCRSDLNVNLW